MPNESKTVFISYAHQPGPLPATVATLAAHLRARGLNVVVDIEFTIKPPEQGWLQWMQQGIEAANIVLVVCTERYRQLFTGNQPEDDGGRGVGWEAAFINQALYNNHVRNSKFFPILPEGGLREHVPDILQAFDNGHYFPRDNDKILLLINDDRQASPAKPGKAASGHFHMPDLSPCQHFFDPANHLSTLRKSLLDQGQGGQSAILAKSSVAGMGGVGKTQLALKYCHDYRFEYIGVWWFRAEHASLLEQDCQVFCQANGFALVPGMPVNQAFRDGLARLGDWLLVFDNAEDRQMLARFLPSGGAHHVIITSRRTGWKMASLELNVWSQDQALPFLRARLPAEGLVGLRALADALGGLPLALEQACAYLDVTGMALADYLAELGDCQQRPALLAWQNDDGHPSVFQTLSLAFDRLSDTARALLALCGWCGPEPIPEWLFGDVPEDGQEYLPAVLRGLGKNPPAWRATVAELTGYALCKTEVVDTQNPRHEAGRHLVFHRLTQAAIRAKLGDGAAVQVLGLLRAAFPGDVRNPKHWPRCRVLMPHVQGLEEFYQEAWGEQRRYHWLLDRLGNYLRVGPALYGEAERLLRRALAVSQSGPGEEDPATLTAIHNLANLHWAKGDWAGARALQEKCLELSRRVLGDEHPDTLAAMGNLAATLWDQGDLPGARVLEEKTLELRRRVLGDEHPDTLAAMAGLAATLWNQGDLPGARALNEKTLELHRRVLGDEHPHTLAAMAGLAATLRSQGDLPGARALNEKTLELRRRVLGDEHPATLTSMNNLAVTLYAQGDFPGARALLASTHALRSRVLGEQHPSTLTVKRNLDGIPLPGPA